MRSVHTTYIPPHFFVNRCWLRAIYNHNLTINGNYIIGIRQINYGQIIVIIAVYISPNTKIVDIDYFLKSSLFAVSTMGAAYLGR